MSSTSKLTSRRASIFWHLWVTNVRLTLRKQILTLLAMGFCFQPSARPNRRRRFAGGSRHPAPGKEPALQKGEEPAEQEGCDSNGDDSRINSLEVQHFPGGFDHVAHSLACVHHLGQDHIGPANVVENAE